MYFCIHKEKSDEYKNAQQGIVVASLFGIALIFLAYKILNALYYVKI